MKHELALPDGPLSATISPTGAERQQELNQARITTNTAITEAVRVGDGLNGLIEEYTRQCVPNGLLWRVQTYKADPLQYTESMKRADPALARDRAISAVSAKETQVMVFAAQDWLFDLRRRLRKEIAMRHAYTILTTLDRAGGAAKPGEIRVEADISVTQLKDGANLLRAMGLVALEGRGSQWRYYRLPSQTARGRRT